MRIALLTNVQNSIGRIAVKREAEHRGHTLDVYSLFNSEISDTGISSLVEQLSKYDVVHHAGGLGVFVAGAVQRQLMERGVFCVNNFTLISSNIGNKVYQAVTFSRYGIPIPRTARSHRPKFDALAATLGTPFIAKDPQGTHGSRVWLVNTENDLAHLKVGKEYVFQEFIENDGDFRVHVVGGDTTFCPYKRVPVEGEFRSNVSLGATVTSIDSKEEREVICKLAISAAKALNLDYCGVDIVRSLVNGSYYVLETNSDPGFKQVEECTGESFAIPIVDYYESVHRATK